ncbi:MAG: flagellar basal body L-ring protein FlgH [Pseudomonadota bacterium]
MTLTPRHLLWLAGLLLAGCNSAPQRDPAYAPVRPEPTAPLANNNGTIYQPGSSVFWAQDLSANRIGDILTVKLMEKTTSKKDANSKTSKTSSNTTSNPTLFGQASPINLHTSISADNAFEGKGESSQNNQLSGDLSVTVVEVLSNGNLVVRGEKRLGINQGNEYLKLSGIIRPYDIKKDNSVDSTKIADPTIVYVGEGDMNDVNVMGWVARFFISSLFPI